MNLEIITHGSLAPVRHGFFTRRGGESTGVFAGLNGGLGSSDRKETVTANRAKLAEAMDAEPGDLRTVHQTHSADVAIMDVAPVERARADAMVTATTGPPLMILTADCQPILFADAAAGVVGAAHAGWKGALGGVIEATVEAMEDLGARRENINAVIGPSISQRNYEVGPEFFEAFRDGDPESVHHFANGEGDRFLFDLPGYGLSRLRRAGVGDAHWTGHCTYADEDSFYSHRRAVHRGEADYGRLMSAIRL